MSEWAVHVIFKADRESAEDAESLVWEVLQTIDAGAESELSDQPYILKTEEG